LITSGADGTVKIWNFSNGSILNELTSAEKKEKVDSEITSFISIFDPEGKKVKTAQFLAVGWDKKLHIWEDPSKNDDGNGEDAEEE
jgi:WD40 repeat protein